MLLEIAVFNIESALAAARAGADRIELCENITEGGTTPSYGALKTVREKLTIPIFPMIRARGGDFFYSDTEFDAMKKDILLCKELGFEGLVTGLLNADGSVDTERTKQLVGLAYPMEVTFHRAFDRSKDPLQSLEDIISCGCQRILTSGQVPSAWDGKELIKQLVEQAGERLIIIPGSGVNSGNALQLSQYTGAKELHTSARIFTPSQMQYAKESMKENLQSVLVNEDEIRKIKAIIKGK